jgi:hypothetical protein
MRFFISKSELTMLILEEHQSQDGDITLLYF